MDDGKDERHPATSEAIRQEAADRVDEDDLEGQGQ